MKIFSLRLLEITLGCKKSRVSSATSRYFSKGSYQANNTIIQKDHTREGIKSSRVLSSDEKPGKANRRTTVSQASNKESQCPFKMIVYLDCKGFWYLSVPIYHESCLHKYHVKVNASHVTLHGNHMSQDVIDLMNNCSNARVNPSSVSSIIAETFNVNLTNESIYHAQQKRLEKEISNFLNDPMSSSAAEKLIAFFQQVKMYPIYT